MTTPALVIMIVVALAAPQTAPRMKTVDTGLGFSISVPESWAKGRPTRNNKFLIGSLEEDFSVVVADFGPAQSDAAMADAVYRESFARHGLVPTTETEVVVGGKPVKRYVLRLETPDGVGHAEAVMLRVQDEVYAVMVVTPASDVERRREVIAAILGSIAFG
jgi:hypothetical protein